MPLRIPRIAYALAAALLLALAVSNGAAQSTTAQSDYRLIEARIAAERQDDGRVKVALELRRSDAGWDERIQPRRRYLAIDSPIDMWRYTEPLQPIESVPGRLRIAARRIPHGHVEIALQRDLGAGWGDLLLPYARQLDSPRFGPIRFATSSVDLVDDGPTRCRLGLILAPGDRCRFPDTRELLIIQADGVARYPVDPYEARNIDDTEDTLTSSAWRTYFVVPFMHGITLGESTKGVHIESLEGGEFIILRIGRDRLLPANGADCAVGLLVRFGHYCGMPTGFVWFVVYPEGPAQLTAPNLERSWISATDLQAEVVPYRNIGRHIVHAVREAEGWRITTLSAPGYPLLPIAPIDLGGCHLGLVVGPEQSCSDPASPATFWVDAYGHWGWDEGPTNPLPGGLTVTNHPNGHSHGFDSLPNGHWIVSFMANTGADPKLTGACRVDHVVYPGEYCHGVSRFQVFPNGLAWYGNVTGRNRVHETGSRISDDNDVINSYDFTAERQDDGGFRIVHMRQRRLDLERQVQRELGDCRPGLVLGSGDACRYPDYGDLFLVRDDGSAAFGAIGSRDSDDGLHFNSWGRGSGYILHRPLAERRHILIAVGDDTSISIGACNIGATVQPGQRCRPRTSLPELYVFDEVVFFDDTVSREDLRVDQPDLDLALHAERQDDGSYIIRRVDAASDAG